MGLQCVLTAHLKAYGSHEMLALSMQSTKEHQQLPELLPGHPFVPHWYRPRRGTVCHVMSCHVNHEFI